MSKGTNTTTTAPNPTAMSAYNDILSRAQGVSNTPYTPYAGELVAGVNPQQSAGIANINSNWNYAQPYMQTAAGYATDAATPLTTEQIQQYMSPYTQNVVNATQEQFRHDNAVQQQGVLGNAAAQGALGGNRVGVAQAQTAEAQQRAQAPVIAGLYNQAYTTGLNTALTEQQARAQGAYSLGNLGVSGQNAALTGANAQIGAGTLQQGTQQAIDAARYQQFVNQQAYPFQTAQWLAGIGTGVGSQMGGTSTGPAPNLTSQLLGAGTAGAGILGGTGAFGSAGWLTALMANGGAVGRASGGVAPPEGPMTLPETPATLKLQQRQLLNGHRRVQMFPRGTPELPLPRGMSRLDHSNGAFHYDPRRIDARDIHRLSDTGRENDLLDLGPYSKDDVLKRLQGGEIPVAVVERHPDGTEVRAAMGTHSTADRQMAAMNRTKSPGHIVRTEDPRETIEHRLRAFGGRVPGFAGGGAPMEEAPPTNGVGAVMAGTPYRSGSGWIPRMDVTRGQGAPRPAGVAPSPSLAQQAKEIGSLANIISDGGRNRPGNFGGSPETNPNLAPYAGEDESEGLYRGGMVHRASGGVANLPFHHMVPHLAEGGSPYDTDYFDAPMPEPPRMPSQLNTTGPASWESGKLVEVPTDLSGIEPGTFGYAPPGTPRGVAPAYAYANEEEQRSRPARAEPSSLDDAAWPHGPVGAPGGGGREDDGSGGGRRHGVAPGINFGADSKLWPALMTAGMGMMASKSPFAGVAIGEGGLAGMQAYGTERQREDRINSEVKKLAQEAEFAQKRLDLQTRPFTEQTADQRARSEEAKLQHERPYTEQTADQRARLEQARLQHETMTPYQKAQLDRENLQYVGNNEEGFPVYLDRRSGKETIGTTKVQQKSPAGYVRNPDGTMAPIKGGPADPEVVAGLLKAKSGAQIPDATADFLAERVLNGDSRALVGLGRGAQGAENIVRIQGLVAQKAAERGMNPQDILAKIAEQSGLTASQRTFGTQIAKMAVNSTEAEGAIHQGLEVSKNVPRTKFVPVNKLIQMAESNISDPDLLEFRAANLAIINTYARAISPTGTPTVHDKEEAMKVVSEATSPEAYDRVMRRMLKEIEIAHAAPAQAKKELERIRKSSASPVEPSPVVTSPGSRPTITTKEEFDRLPSGAEYIRDGNAYRKP